MPLARYRRLDHRHPVRLARLVRHLESTSSADLLRPPSLVTSFRAFSFLSEVGGADLKQSGLLPSAPYSATQNLAYLPCRIGSYGSTFRLFARGGVRKKPPSRKIPRPLFSSRHFGQVCGHIPDPLSRSAFMRFENHHEATKVFPSHPRFLFPASPQQASDSLPRAAAQGRSPLPPHASLTSQPGVLPPELFLLRCRQKGCVFPAQRGGRGECAYHRRQSLEPGCFQSQQPTFLLLDQAKFGLPDSEPDDGRVRDRHRLAEERVQFMLGDAA